MNSEHRSPIEATTILTRGDKEKEKQLDAELLKAELSNTLNLEAPENTPAPDAPKNVDVEKVGATLPAELESPFKRKLMPEACKKAYFKHQETLKKQQELKVVEKKCQAEHAEILKKAPSSTKRLLAKIGLGTAKIERYDAELARTQGNLSKIEHAKKSYKKILSDKNALNLIAQYDAIIDHNSKFSAFEAQSLKVHSAKLERERELAEEQARQFSELENQRDWTIGLDPTENQKIYVSASNDLSL
ncbi:hypothetical protein [Paracidovorax citrulli]|uniref:hypothetical protein n=1 Tax=Paracidovorax citrulli TaxID=80869 RepID=UPI001269FDEC|nr:hypothetical protein [Paracidovorax citrulli]